MKEGLFLSSKDYIELCKKRDFQKPNFCKILYTMGAYTKNPVVKLQIRKQNKTKTKPGVYDSINPDKLEGIIILAPNNTLKQTRWLECLVFMTEHQPLKMYLYFEPYFFDHIKQNQI